VGKCSHEATSDEQGHNARQASGSRGHALLGPRREILPTITATVLVISVMEVIIVSGSMLSLFCRAVFIRTSNRTLIGTGMPGEFKLVCACVCVCVWGGGGVVDRPRGLDWRITAVNGVFADIDFFSLATEKRPRVGVTASTRGVRLQRLGAF